MHFNDNQTLSLRVVDPIAAEGVWATVDDGCNSGCHGEVWRQNVEAKIKVCTSGCTEGQLLSTASEPGPLGMRAEHWYDFGEQAGDSNLFVQVVAHIAAAAGPHSVLQNLRFGQVTRFVKPTLLMMSFLRRIALKSVMAAEKESVAKCAGPLQHCVGGPDGANTMIKTIQYLAEADPTRVLVALDLKAAFQNVSRRARLHGV